MDYNDPGLIFGEKKEEELSEMTMDTVAGMSPEMTMDTVPEMTIGAVPEPSFEMNGEQWNEQQQEIPQQQEISQQQIGSYRAPDEGYRGEYSQPKMESNNNYNTYDNNNNYNNSYNNDNGYNNANYNTYSYDANQGKQGGYATNVEGTSKPEGVGALAVTSLVMGILSLVCCCMGVGVVFGIAGIILSVISITNKKGNGVAIGGLVTSIIGFIFGVLIIIYAVFVGSAVMKDPEFNEIMEGIKNGTYSYEDAVAGDNGATKDWMDGLY